MTKKMYKKPQVEVTVQVETKQPVMLLDSGSGPEPSGAPRQAPASAPAAAGHTM